MTPMVEFVYESLSNIHTLIVHQPAFIFPFQTKTSLGKQAPLRFFTHSLRKLFVTMWSSNDCNFKARNVVWLLVNCLQLTEASLGCLIEIEDSKFLSDHAEAFSGLSNVRRLALAVSFTREEWEGGANRSLVGGNRKTQAVYNLLRVTKNLLCLELNNHDLPRYDFTTLNSSCYSGLHKTSPSIVHLRLFGIGPNLEDIMASSFSLPQSLRVFSTDWAMLLNLSRVPGIKLPTGLETLWMPFHTAVDAKEDRNLTDLFNSRTSSNLKLLLLPLIPTKKRVRQLLLKFSMRI